MTRAVTPKTMYNREGFEMLRTKGEEGFCKGEGGVDDEMKCYDGDPGLFVKPLKVVLRSYLNGSGFCEGKVCSGAIERTMI